MVRFQGNAFCRFPRCPVNFIPVIFFLLFSIISAGPEGWGATYTVTTLSDDGGEGSLRWAIASANTHPGPDMITFYIPGPGVKIISPTSALPDLWDNGTTINGYSQPGASPATAGAAAVMQIVINGGLTGASVGLNIRSSGNVIRGLVINNFAIHGVAITGTGATGNVVSGNYIGTESTGNADQGNGGNGIFIASGASANFIGGDNPANRNIISGNSQSGIRIDGIGTDVNTVSGNYIGLNAGGTTPLPNSVDGVRISGGAFNNRIGGATEGERNVISGNAAYGIRLEGAETNSNLIQGNYIGPNSSGTGEAGGQDTGIFLLNGANHNIIGGSARNVISGNGDTGIRLFAANYNFISGNFIGTDPGGTVALGNYYGIYLTNSSNNVIGEDRPGMGNVISGNDFGIKLGDSVTPGSDATNNIISRNYIGTDYTGQNALGNNVGLSLGPRAANNVIGGDSPGSGNLISGNQFIGIWLQGGPDICRSYTIKGNFIGTDYLGRNPLGNLNDGIYFGPMAQSNFVGPDNVIAFNGGDGVQVDTPTATGNLITRNRIFANADKGIRLSGGSNGGISAPMIQNTTLGSIHIAVRACSGCAVQVFNSWVADGEGEIYLGGGLADGTGNYILEVSGLPYPYLTATASNADGTSEFSGVFTSTAYLLHLPLILH